MKPGASATVYETFAGAYGNCHTGNVLVFADTESPLTVYGGGANAGMRPDLADVILDLGAFVSPLVTLVGPTAQGFQRIAAYARLPVKINLVWPDGGAPAIAETFWMDLLTDLRTEARQRGALYFLTACVGGHGRTGTALAILAHLAGAVPDDVVTWLRGQYCPMAVETQAQMRYIERFTQYPIGEKPSLFELSPQGKAIQHSAAWWDAPFDRNPVISEGEREK